MAGQDAARVRGRALRRDPAPSRLSYRLHRLWLTPAFRTGLRVGVPAGLVLLVSALVFGSAQRRQDMAEWVADTRREVQERPEFMIGLMSIEGASPELSRELRAALPLRLPASSFDLDLEAMRAAAEALDAVAKAELRVRPGGVLQLAVTERIPVVVWRGRDTLQLLDATGHRVAEIEDRNLRPDLPLIVGDGADTAMAEAAGILVAAVPISDRLRGLVRMGERRWDVVLDHDLRILLPADDPVAALERVIALHQAQDLLSRDLVAVDLRNARRPTLRLAPGALTELRRTQTPAGRTPPAGETNG